MSEDDDLIWLEVTADVQKIKSDKQPYIRTSKSRFRGEKEETHIPVLRNFKHDVELNSSSDIDKQTLKRFKREEFGVEASLDLHGFTLNKAFSAVQNFVRTAYLQNKRAILIVTGKGLPHKEQDIFEVKGALKQSVPQWLRSDELRPMILTFIHPSPKLGGSGALYILLRRQRT